MTTGCRVVAFCVCVVLQDIAIGQEAIVESTMTSLCDLVKEPGRFNGKIVQLRADLVSGRHSPFFSDQTCGASVPWSLGRNEAVSTDVGGEYAFVHFWQTQQFFPEQLDWKPVRPLPRVVLRADDAYREVVQALGHMFDPSSTEDQCRYCPNYEIRVTVVGRFDYCATHVKAIRDTPGGPIRLAGVGCGPMAASLYQVVVQSVSDVVVKPIDRPAPTTPAARAQENIVRLPSGDVTLPKGFTHKPRKGIDSQVGSFISPDGSLVIDYDIGPFAGVYARRRGASEFSEAQIGGTTMMIELRGQPPSKVFITFPAYGPTNFSAAVRGGSDIEIVKEIAVSFKPRK